ncbi:deoxycytidine triphosphate deaminase, partial [Chlamydia psittaci C1/97]
KTAGNYSSFCLKFYYAKSSLAEMP